MNLNRRSFFKAAAAAPIAARQAAGAALSGQLGMGGIPYGPPPPPLGEGSGPGAWEQAQNQVIEMVRAKAIPTWKMRQFRQQARIRARFLDADILSMRSMSDGAKYRAQEDRELERVIRECVEDHESQRGWSALYQSFREKVWGSNDGLAQAGGLRG